MFFYVEVYGNLPVQGADDATEAMWMDWDEALQSNLAFDHEDILRELIPSSGAAGCIGPMGRDC